MDEYKFYNKLFSLQKRFQNKKIILYGLNDDTKKALNLLAYLEIRCIAFFDTSKKNDKGDFFYIGIPVITEIKDLPNSAIVLDVWGKNIEIIRNECQSEVDILFSPITREVVLYGAGGTGVKAIKFLSFFGVNILNVFDKKSIENKNMTVEGIKVYPPDYLKTISNKNIHVVIAIENTSVSAEVENNIRKLGYSNVLSFNGSVSLEGFSLFLYIPRQKSRPILFTPYCLRYIQTSLLPSKDIYFFSTDIEYLKKAIKVLKCLGIPIKNAASTENKCDIKINDVVICNVWDLIYKDPSSFVVWSLPDDFEACKRFMEESGIPSSSFLYGINGPLRLNRTYEMDTNLGFSDKRVFVELDNQVDSSDCIKVGILGGSTSDYDLYYEKSWVEYLLEYAKKNNVHMKCIDAATCGNISAQEITRLTRDLLWEKPDIVISYSRINEISLSITDHSYTHVYQEQITNAIVKANRGLNFFGANKSCTFSMGRKTESPGEVWIANERILYSICKEFGIKFFSFLQPSLYTKCPETRKDIELKEVLGCELSEERIRQENLLVEYVKSTISKYEWMKDYTTIFNSYDDDVFFDHCHLVSDKNKILAHKIYNCIMR